MADAIVSVVLEQLASFIVQETSTGVRLLWGARQAVESLPRTLRTIQAVLRDAEERQVKEESVQLWLDELKEAAYDMDDVLDEWNTSVLKLQIEKDEIAPTLKKKVCFFFPSPGYCFRQAVFRYRIALTIKDINQRLDVIATEKDKYGFIISNRSIEQPQRVKTTSFVDVSDIFGRDEEQKTLVSKLLSGSSTSGHPKHLQIISILGMGGIGKTSLAQLVYNNNQVIKNFEKRIWVCVSDPFNELMVAKAIIEALEGESTNLVELQSILEEISKFIEGKKFLLVLDDVWTEDYDKWRPFYNCLKNGLSGSKILVTTRKETVGRMMESDDTINVSELNENQCWLLFERLALFDRSPEERENLEKVGREIVGKCKGLPLAVKIIGSLLHLKKTRDEWQCILESGTWKVENFEKDLFHSLALSYNDLPFMVKQCFSYCSIFPKDYEFEKDQLIQLWMAQGYLTSKKNREMEIVGQEYFYVLAMRSFFQEFRKDDDNNIIGCKMHDMVHDFAQFITRNECFTIDKVNDSNEPSINSDYGKALHVGLTLGTMGLSSLISMYDIKKLRSLLIHCRVSTDTSPTRESLPKICDQLACLRVLSINEDDWLENIPREVGKLKHLRYINLSYNRSLRELPEVLCDLYNLQTLDLTSCRCLEKLPQGMNKLINLRHLLNENTSLRYMPKGMERLTCLRTLSKFFISDADHASKACTLECLKNFNHPRSLGIEKLGNMTDVVDAKKAELKNKNNLFSLYLSFNSDYRVVRVKEEDEVLIEALEPPPHLEKLELKFYSGNSFPSWMMSYMSLSKLRMLDLCRCNNWEHLPPLGQLSSLESLSIWGMPIVRRVGKEFLGIENSSSPSLIAFPKLKSLKFLFMENWEEWDFEITREGKQKITIMPCLRSFVIVFCFNLNALPDQLLQMKTLEELEIFDCFMNQPGQRYNKGTGKDWSKIAHIPNIKIDGVYVQRDGS